MIVVALLMIILGAVSIVMGFWPDFPNTRAPGAVFFVGGWLLIGLDRICWRLDTLMQALAGKPKEERDPQEGPEQKQT